ncbi:MAG TPA: zf-HC2 domain-containing protein [Bryobacteraceae bacterium]|nr:zf-HC2 domain-containing protein [Bryobacteraceae bacterium]
MSRCWLDGELRAYVDRELPAREMEAIEWHLRECDVCAALLRELGSRAARVGVLLEAMEYVPAAAPVVVRRAARWGPVLVAALAAACFVLVLWLPKRQRIVTPPKAQVAASAPTTTGNAGSLAAGEPRRRQDRQRYRKAQPQYYVALDDEPIESGVVVRVALPDSGLLADVIYDEQGRPRAVRPLN